MKSSGRMIFTRSGFHVHAGGGLHHLLDRLHAGPHAGVAAHRKAVQAHVQDALHVRRKEQRKAAGLEDVVALVRRGAALGHVVITRNRDHAAVRRGAGEIRVLEHIRAAVHPRALAVPDAEHAVELLVLGVELHLLRAPHRGGGQLFVHAGLEHHVVRRQVFLRGPQRLVVAAQGAAAVAGHEAGGVQALLRVAHLLQHGQAHQGLRAAHEGPAAVQRVLVVQRGGFQGAADGVGQRCIHGGRGSCEGQCKTGWAEAAMFAKV